MNLNIWGLIKGLFKDKPIVQKEIVKSTETWQAVVYKHIRVKKGKRRYVLKFAQTTKKVPEWVRRNNLGRLTTKEMSCLN